MGTHSRIVIKRKRGGNLNFWQHFDGYLEGVGKELCDVIRELLVEFSTEELVIMSNHMACEVVDGDSKFETSMLKDILIGKSKAICDNCHNFEYEYVVDLHKECLTAQHGDVLVKLPFVCVKSGLVFSDFVKFL